MLAILCSVHRLPSTLVLARIFWDDVHRAKVTLMDGGSRRMRYIGEPDEDIVEISDVTNGDGLTENPIAEVLDELVLLR